AIFPYLWRERAGRGAKLFVNITNDGWYLDTAAPYQHFISNVFRAVENGVPLLRSANTGLSGYIDAYGRVRSVTRLGAETVLFAEMEPALPGYTFYSRSGDFFAFVCAVFLAALGLRIWRKKLRA
ncbi:MAG: nitrilase-related carbon-nitrogen hydrolase, partial [Elusimicrobiaceae bacterium]